MTAEFIEGPLWTVALTVFLVGVVWRLVSIITLRRPRDLTVPRASAGAGAFNTNLRRFFARGETMQRSALQVVAGYMFHLGLFALLFWAAPHVAFLEERVLGFGWTPMPHWAFVVSAQIAFAGLIMLWLWRLMHPVLRQLSSLDDHLAAVLTFIVMLTGCMALLESSTALRLTHMLSVEVWLIYFPFSNLMHAFTVFFSRGYTGATFARRGVQA